jgi:PKHD-type hydroxylase
MSTPNTFFPLRLDHVHPYALWGNAFTALECEQIIELGNSINLKNATTMGKTDLRKSQISWLYPNKESQWIFERISYIITDLNDKYFDFNLHGLAEGLQFTKYQEPDSEYRKHTDRLFSTVTRKLSISIQLSDPSSYDGGELCLYQEESPTRLPKEQGTLIIFPSFMLHEVKKVTQGTRYSLVAWVIGDPFK